MQDEIDITIMSAPESNKRLAKNTMMLYFRQIIIMLVSLYTVRVVLSVLGAEDYGIYNVVAGIVTMFGFISGAMTIASQRYFSYEIGRGNRDQLQNLFSMSVIIYILIAIGVVLLSETVGVWFCDTYLKIPQTRISAARWVYQFSIVSVVVTLLVTPYTASIIAHENMDVYAYVSIVEAALKLISVFILQMMPYDKLVVYGILLFFVSVIIALLYGYICRKKYRECRFRFFWDGSLFREMTSYIGWNLFGAGVGVAKNQAINVILNIYCGPIVNAARAIASQINAAVSSFSQNFSTAVRPQIIKSYVANKKDAMLALVFRSCKATYFLMFVFALPLVLEMQYILKLWLKDIPEYTALFVRLALFESVVESISYPIMAVAHATGKIRLYQGAVGGVLLLNLPISWVVLYFGAPAYSVMVIMVCITMIAFFVRIYIVKRLVSFSLVSFVRTVLFPLTTITIFSSIVPTGIVFCVPESWGRFVVTVLCSVFFSMVFGFFIGLSKTEKRNVIIDIRRRMRCALSEKTKGQDVAQR